jgi:putative transposase
VPIAPNAQWVLDLQFDTAADDRRIKLLNIIDETTRGRPAIGVRCSIDADLIVATLDRLAMERGAPAFARFENGPEFIAHAVADWCRFKVVVSIFTDPGSAWQNAGIESFKGRPRDELLNGQRFDSLLEAKVLIEDGRIDHNIKRPHSAKGDVTPSQFAEARINQDQAVHTEPLDPSTGNRQLGLYDRTLSPMRIAAAIYHDTDPLNVRRCDPNRDSHPDHSS